MSGRPTAQRGAGVALRSLLRPSAVRVQIVATLYTLVVALDATPYDDALFFKRFALNFWSHGAFAWNPGEGSVHGNTSQLLQLLAVLLTAASEHYVVAVKVLLAFTLVATFAVLASAARRGGGRSGVLLLPWLSPIVLGVVHSGMETACVLLVLAAFFRWGSWQEDHALQPVRSGALTLLAYLARPDAALVPFVATLVAQRSRPRLLLRYVAILGLSFAVLLGFFHLYYGSALPLPAYWKTGAFARYDAAFVTGGLPWKYRYLATFTVFSAPLAWAALRGYSPRLSPLLAASAALVLYHALMTTEIMGYHARFYVPALVPLSLAGACAWGRYQRRSGALERLAFAVALTATTLYLFDSAHIETPDPNWHLAIGLSTYLVWLAVVAARFLAGSELGRWSVPLLLLLPFVWLPPRWPGELADMAYLKRFWSEVTTVRGLFDVKACLGPTPHVYHSEIGVPGVLLKDAKITDLSGLMNPELTFRQKTVVELCLRDRPDAIFLPHRAYAKLNEALLTSSCLHDYTRVVDRSSSPLYIRNDLLKPFLACAREIWEWSSLTRPAPN